MEERRLRIDILIHLFALAHATVVVVSRAFDYVDDIPLTLLTISMITLISIRRNLQMEVIAALALSGCFLGYALGIYGAEIIVSVVGNGTAASAITTAAVTELLGWIAYGLSRFEQQRVDMPTKYPDSPTVISVMAAIMIFRIAYVSLTKAPFFNGSSIYDELQRLTSNTLALVSLLGGCVIISSLPHGLKKRHPNIYYAMIATLLLLLALIVSLFVCYDLPAGNDYAMEWESMLRMFVAVAPVCIVIYTIALLIAYVVATDTKFRNERDKKHKALYQYDNLKRQINPHFLFNSLNILEYLVEEGEQSRASAFIRKLAGMYRYMLQNDEKRIVSLEEELDFAQKYIDLLAERFAEGLSVEIALSDGAKRGYVVPCSLQLLIENATKHNIVSRQQPLVISITDADGMIVVRNNLQPRISGGASTGLGLKNIGQQYTDISGQGIDIVRTRTEFIVKLPLLQTP